METFQTLYSNCNNLVIKYKQHWWLPQEVGRDGQNGSKDTNLQL